MSAFLGFAYFVLSVLSFAALVVYVSAAEQFTIEMVLISWALGNGLGANGISLVTQLHKLMKGD